MSVSMMPSARRLCSWGDVKRSRTTVCPSTPLMKMGTGSKPPFSMILCAGVVRDAKRHVDGNRASTASTANRKDNIKRMLYAL